MHHKGSRYTSRPFVLSVCNCMCGGSLDESKCMQVNASCVRASFKLAAHLHLGWRSTLGSRPTKHRSILLNIRQTNGRSQTRCSNGVPGVQEDSTGCGTLFKTYKYGGTAATGPVARCVGVSCRGFAFVGFLLLKTEEGARFSDFYVSAEVGPVLSCSCC